MSSRVYTERFLTCTGTAASVSWFVPAGMRAIVTSVVIAQVSGNEGVVQAVVGPAVVYQRRILAAEGTTSIGMRCVAYAGEDLSAYTEVSGIYLTIGGYLFEDPQGATGPPPGLGQKPNPIPGQLRLPEDC